ncbi:MAG: peptidyl-prolyl cis-trans isomerase, partial [Ignavibacteriales bacterium]
MSKSLLILFSLCSLINQPFAQNEKDFSDYDESFTFQQDEIVAEVDTLKISADEFFYSYEFGPAFVKKKPGSKSRHLNYMINEKLLALDGYTKGIDTLEQTKDYLAEFISDLATEELFKQDILSDVDIQSSEIDTVINKKRLELEIKWLYSDSEEGIKDYIKSMNSGISFDSLFSAQINDSIFLDERYMKVDRAELEQKNPLLAKIIDSLKAGEVSIPIHVEDGWYIVKLNNAWENMITTATEYEKFNQEAVNVLTKKKMDVLSDKYVNELMSDNQPVIKRNTFNFLRSYLGNYLL